jgi:dihydrolipoamide dehydrogenase
MTALDCDVAVVGAGTAGLAAERSARRAGAKTLLIDDGFVGTTCASVGCMPSKLLIAAAHAAHVIRAAAVFGIGAQEPIIDGPAVMRRVRRERDAFVAGTLKSIAAIPDDIKVRARAHFLDQTRLALDDGRIVSAKAIVIATGSRPMVPPMFEALGPMALTNETIFELSDLPASIAVIGAGPLGLELAQALVRLGVDVDVFDQGERLAGLHDLEVAAELKLILERELPVRLGVKISVDCDGDGVSLSWTGTSAGTKRFERLLVATGRPPQLGGLSLAAASGLAMDKHGTPLFDRNTMQCGTAPVFMAGDACGQVPVLHEAASEGAIAGRNAASFPTVHPASRSVAFATMFTDPPLAVVGKPDADRDVIGSASYADQGRAKVEARNVGLVRLYADRQHGRLIGAVMLGPAMDHMAHLLAWAIERGETATRLLELPFYHPTFEEGLKPALHEICRAVEAAGAFAYDEGKLPGA